MTNIQSLRHIVTDIHKVYPQGIRKAYREGFSNSLSAYKKGFRSYAPEEVYDYALSNLKKQKKLNSNIIQAYLSEIYYKEQDMFLSKRIKDVLTVLNVKIIDKSNQVTPEIESEMAKGLIKSHNAGLKLPKTVIVKKSLLSLQENITNFLLDKLNLRKYMFDEVEGTFKNETPSKIFVKANSDDIAATTIHEIIHKNHLSDPIVNKLNIFSYDNQQVLNDKAILIKKEIGDYALTDLLEFVACTAQKLITENQNWNNFDSIVKKLYENFSGPQIYLNKPAILPREKSNAILIKYKKAPIFQ